MTLQNCEIGITKLLRQYSNTMNIKNDIAILWIIQLLSQIIECTPFSFSILLCQRGIWFALRWRCKSTAWILQTYCKGNKELLQPHNVMRLQYLRNDIVMNSELLALTDTIRKSASKVLITLCLPIISLRSNHSLGLPVSWFVKVNHMMPSR